MKLGDKVMTPRFCTVKITAMFEDEQEARKCGYTEPTYPVVVLLKLSHRVSKASKVNPKPSSPREERQDQTIVNPLQRQ